MVYFNCNGCAEALKKQQVDKHFRQCRRCQFVSCSDCQNEFWGDSYREHIKCVTEDEKYGGKNYKPKASANKGEQKQNQWLEQVQQAIGKVSANQQLTAVLERLVDYPNVPRKKAKFENFVKNSLGVRNNNLASMAWDLISAEMQKQQELASSKIEIVNGSASEGNDKERITPSNGREVPENSVENSQSASEKKRERKERKEKSSKDYLKKTDGINEETVTNGDWEEGGDKKTKKKKKRKRENSLEEEKEEEDGVKRKKIKNTQESQSNGLELPKLEEVFKQPEIEDESKQAEVEGAEEERRKPRLKIEFVTLKSTVCEILSSADYPEHAVNKVQLKAINDKSGSEEEFGGSCMFCVRGTPEEVEEVWSLLMIDSKSQFGRQLVVYVDEKFDDKIIGTNGEVVKKLSKTKANISLDDSKRKRTRKIAINGTMESVHEALKAIVKLIKKAEKEKESAKEHSWDEMLIGILKAAKDGEISMKKLSKKVFTELSVKNSLNLEENTSTDKAELLLTIDKRLKKIPGVDVNENRVKYIEIT